MKPIVAIIMGSDSDLPIMKEAAEILDELKIPYEMTIVSAHRTPDRMYEYSKSAKKRGLKVIISGAGGAAHAPGVAAALTTLPVIGVPVKGKNLDGLDSLLSMVQMPPGIPVATVGINAAKNAGLLAAVIIGAFDKRIAKKLDDYKKSLSAGVLSKAKKLETIKYKKYLDTLK